MDQSVDIPLLAEPAAASRSWLIVALGRLVVWDSIRIGVRAPRIQKFPFIFRGFFRNPNHQPTQTNNYPP